MKLRLQDVIVIERLTVSSHSSTLTCLLALANRLQTTTLSLSRKASLISLAIHSHTVTFTASTPLSGPLSTTQPLNLLTLIQRMSQSIILHPCLPQPLPFRLHIALQTWVFAREQVPRDVVRAESRLLVRRRRARNWRMAAWWKRRRRRGVRAGLGRGDWRNWGGW